MFILATIYDVKIITIKIFFFLLHYQNICLYSNFFIIGIIFYMANILDFFFRFLDKPLLILIAQVKI